ncbi:OmpA family protein [Shimia sp. CNT1-13L.2]|uniref:OmpA family protein n=1 Tax=Shimia sp. CNT1-13L.2 TaxID=2959663 RepID=UPI0020CD4FB9|nr:OmpA family protein [Shimia sp. CNT1-13L.2]MCP9484062.1 OmpA family protein [Shimia sp. CNT1-13L.2]
MRLSDYLPIATTFTLAAGFSAVAAVFSADLIEEASRRGVQSELAKEGMTWATIHAEGLQVFITGVAPTEAERFKAISSAGKIVDAARVIDNMQIEATADIGPPRFSIEILRNDSGIQLIGLIPEDSNRAEIIGDLRGLDGSPVVTDFLETAEYDVPEGWQQALSYALFALEELPRAKISLEAGRVSVTAMSDSPEARRELEGILTRKAPPTLDLALTISAPRPVITPFTLRFLIDDLGARFDACSADTEDARSQILAAATQAGLEGSAACTIGLGVPTPSWGDAVETAISGLSELGGGSVTFSDADITLIARIGTEQDLFDKVIGEVESALPEVFALHATRPVPIEETDEGTPEFTATLSPEGTLQLRGRLRDDVSRTMAQSYANARFGMEDVYMAARLDENLPGTWSLRVLAGLDALSQLHNGALTVTPDTIDISGTTGDPQASDRISRLLAEKLDQGDHYALNVRYEEALDPIAQLPTPEECLARLQEVQGTQKISFEPGSGTLDETAGPVIDELAAILQDCQDINLKLEIQGHTDSQGREEMNMALSQTRAQSVLNALHDRRILTGNFSAKGYGEAEPIADNKTEEGREANRRIEFVLIQPEETPPEGENADGEAQTGEETAVDTGANPVQDDAAQDVAPAEQTQDDGQQETTDDQN